MRSVVVLLAALSLTVRWADGPCGCAEHNGWHLLASEIGGHRHADYDQSDDDSAEHDCDGGGRAVFAPGARVPVGNPTLVAPAVTAVEPASVPSRVSADDRPIRPAPARSALKVYRI